MLEYFTTLDWTVILITLVFMAFDILTGFTGAALNKDIDSTKLRRGLLHKLGFILGIAFSVLLDWAQTFVDIGVTFPLCAATCVYIILTEACSVCENLVTVNPQLAEFPPFSLFGPKDDDHHEGSN